MNTPASDSLTDAAPATFTPGRATVVNTSAEVAAIARAYRGLGRPVVLVPTMGALHAGHLALVHAAQRLPGALVMVSIFVNPLQFAEGEDLDAYPRTLEADVAKLADAGVDVVFAPSAREMYPNGPRTTVHPGPAAAELEGAQRPTHFAGVLTVVNKLFNITHCTDAFFGEKDYQQLLLIQQMVTDLNMPVTVHGVPIQRDRDGLALSSRNVYLSESERDTALALSMALAAAGHAAKQGPDAAQAAAAAVLAERPEISVDYCVARAVDLGPAPEEGDGRLLIAARVGSTRLLDNAPVCFGEPEDPNPEVDSLTAAPLG